jgi:hypothetical protein
MLKALNADELFLLHLDVTAELKKRLVAKKDILEEQLQRLHTASAHKSTRSRWPQPPVTANSAIRISLSKADQGWQAPALDKRALEPRQTDRRLSN